MPAIDKTLAGADNYVLQEAITRYSDEAYTNAKKLSGTGIVGAEQNIDTDTETFIGQMRWRTPIDAKINVASLTDSSEGERSSYGTEYLKYVKTVRTHGAKKVNMQQVVTQEDGLAKIGRDFGETRSQDEHNAILSVLKGVAISEVLNGVGEGSGATGMGGQTFDNDPTDKRYGFYVDLGNNPLVTDPAAGNIGAARATSFLRAFGMAFKDYEPEYAYLVVSPEVLSSLRTANLVDSDKVRDGNIEFSTIFEGKFRLIQTRANQSMATAEITKLNTGAGVDIAGTKTSFIVLPGSVSIDALSVPLPTEIERDAAAYKGGGTTDIWFRWGYVAHPRGYSWVGSEEAFASDADYKGVVESGSHIALTAATSGLAGVEGHWKRKYSSALQLGILPIFHG